VELQVGLEVWVELYCTDIKYQVRQTLPWKWRWNFYIRKISPQRTSKHRQMEGICISLTSNPNLFLKREKVELYLHLAKNRS